MQIFSPANLINTIVNIKEIVHDDNIYKINNLNSQIVRYLGNLSFKNKGTQDKIRQEGLIIFILNNCNISDENPFIKEHSIFAV